MFFSSDLYRYEIELNLMCNKGQALLKVSQVKTEEDFKVFHACSKFY